MWFFKRKEIYNQIDTFVSWKSDCISDVSAKSQKDILYLFAEISKVGKIEEIDTFHINLFKDHVLAEHSNYYLIRAMTALRCFLRYFRTRKIDCFNPIFITDRGMMEKLVKIEKNDTMKGMKKAVGRPKHVDKIKRTVFLKEKADLSFRQIASILKIDVKQVWRWYKYYQEERMLTK
jgi:hypothetical protein